MKAAFFHFFPLGIWTQTGDMTQLEKTRRSLQNLGVDVELFDFWSKRRDYDIMHLFGYSQELASFAVMAKQLGMRVVVSPIATTFTSAWKWKMWGMMDRILPVATTYSNLRRLFEAATVILPGSSAELSFLHNGFGVRTEKMVVINHAVDKALAEASPELFLKQYDFIDGKDFVLMVGRISSHKSQLKVIQTMDGLNIPTVFIGHPAPYEPDYVNRFREESDKRSWIRYLGVVPEEILHSAYAAAKVHVLPSLGECPGLVSLEAGIAGANVVAVREPPVYEHLGDEAYYCNPRSIWSIREAILRAWESPRNKSLQKRLLAGFTWEVIAPRIVDIYQHLTHL